MESVSYVTLILDGAGYVFAEGLAVAAGDVPAPDAHTPEPRRAGAYSVGR